MQPSIALGTVLQNRYRLLSILGQGGFGRTYLAEDTARFNERCALKEFSPIGGSEYTLSKSKELFQREAATLYQIQHPQIPQFRALFEENDRLFLVQDYVEGSTYRTLLIERKAQRLTFSEAEVLQLIQQLLPVLAYLHDRGIIHRDIAPDNIILRQQDNIPVLIDFGVVKAIATRIHSQETLTQATTVGKVGYAPSEQMQTGRAYPNSDLYALAVTAVVLLTGREPQELYDDQTLTWNWQRWAKVNPGLAQILDKMLSYRPSDRYQSVAEVLQAIQALFNPSPRQPSVSPRPSKTAPAPTNSVSRMPTMAVGRQPTSSSYPTATTPASGSAGSRRPAPVIQSANDRSLWENPVALVLTTIGLATVSGIAAWAIVSAVLVSDQSVPSASASPTAVESQVPNPVPSPESPSEYTDQLNLEANGEALPVKGTIDANQTVNYTLVADPGQTLSVALEKGEVTLSVLRSDGNPVEDQAARFRSSWQGVLDGGGYTIRVRPRRNIDQTSYRMNVTLQPAAQPSPSPEASPTPSPSPSPEASPTPSPSPEASPNPEASPSPSEPVINTRTLPLPPGTPVVVPGSVNESVVRRFLVDVSPGQELYTQVLEGEVTLDIRYPDGRVLAGGIRDWQQQLSEGGQYQIDVISNQPTNFALRLGLNNPMP